MRRISGKTARVTVAAQGLGGLLLLAGACQSAESDKVEGIAADPAARTLGGEACPDPGMGGYFFWWDGADAKPGETVALYPYYASHPGASEDLPPGCVDGIEVVPEGFTALTRDETGLALITINEDAPDGARLRVQAAYPGGHGFNDRLNIYHGKENPLVGTWRQKADACPPESAVRELVFTAAGEFSVTWTPFETYKDYWGVYEYDAASNAFRFTEEGGNQIPEDIHRQGTAIITEAGELDISQAFFGTPDQASGSCPANFARAE